MQYLNSFYFTTYTMVTVGYGDITPTNNRETIAAILMMLISCGVFAYLISQIGIIFQDLFFHDKYIQNKINIINQYMQQKNINLMLKYQVREYLDYYLRETNEQNSEVEEIIQQLNDNLRDNLMIEANKIVLKLSPIFKGNFSEKLIQKSVHIIKEYHCPPEMQFSCLQDPDDQRIYFIESGSAEIYVEKIKCQKEKEFHTLKVLKKGDQFGYYSFFTGFGEKTKVRSIEFTKVLSIKRKDFLQLLAEFPSDYEQFCYIKDLMLFTNNFSKILQQCSSCKQFTHDFLNCPQLHFCTDPYTVIKRYNLSGPQSRDLQFQRKTRRSKCSLKCLPSIAETGIRFFDNNVSFISGQDWVISDANSSMMEESEDAEDKSDSSILLEDGAQQAPGFPSFVPGGEGAHAGQAANPHHSKYRDQSPHNSNHSSQGKTRTLGVAQDNYAAPLGEQKDGSTPASTEVYEFGALPKIVIRNNQGFQQINENDEGENSNS